jgi:hypothetical protein
VFERTTIHANRPGDVPYRVRTEGGLVVTEGVAYAAREGDIYVARRSRTVSMDAFDQMMRLEIGNDRTANDQKPLKIDCLEVLSGTLELRDLNSCEGEAAIAVRANGPGEVPYRLDCAGGKSWARLAKVMRTGPETFVGVDRLRFGVTDQEHVNCALKTAQPLKTKVLALHGRKYQCSKPGGANSLTP